MKSILFLLTRELGEAQTAMMLLLEEGGRDMRGMRGPTLAVKLALRMPIVLVFDVSFL